MQDAAQRRDKRPFNLGDLKQGQPAIDQLVVRDLAFDDARDQPLDVGRGDLLERTRGGFDGIGQADDARFTR